MQLYSCSSSIIVLYAALVWVWEACPVRTSGWKFWILYTVPARGSSAQCAQFQSTAFVRSSSVQP